LPSSILAGEHSRSSGAAGELCFAPHSENRSAGGAEFHRRWIQGSSPAPGCASKATITTEKTGHHRPKTFGQPDREYRVSEKDIVGLKNENTSKKARGFVNPQLVKMITFSVLCLGLVSCTVLIILAIWGYAQNDTVWKSVATIVVVMISVALFSVINEKFG
jgi:hypothetical protein